MSANAMTEVTENLRELSVGLGDRRESMLSNLRFYAAAHQEPKIGERQVGTTKVGATT